MHSCYNLQRVNEMEVSNAFSSTTENKIAIHSILISTRQHICYIQRIKRIYHPALYVSEENSVILLHVWSDIKPPDNFFVEIN